MLDRRRAGKIVIPGRKVGDLVRVRVRSTTEVRALGPAPELVRKRRWRNAGIITGAGALPVIWIVLLRNRLARERRRITVYVEGDEVNGIAVRAKEEAEQNTEEKNPSAEEDASWEPMQSDGALARRFLTDLYARLHPPQPQKEQEVR